MTTPRGPWAGLAALALVVSGCAGPASPGAAPGTGPAGSQAAPAATSAVADPASAPGASVTAAEPGTAPEATGSARASDAAPSAAPSAGPSAGRTPGRGVGMGLSPRVAPGTSVTVALTGDLLWHTSLLRSVEADGRRSGTDTYDFEPLFAGVKPYIERADAAICHQEVPILAAGQKPSGYPAFGAPLETARAVKELGFDLCTTASNHSLDRGVAGVRSTLTALRDQGIVVSGTSATREESGEPRIVTTASGVRIAVVTGTWALNGDPSAPSWQWDYLDPQTMIARGERARAAGADIVLAAMHAGTEYVTAPNDDQKVAAAKLAKSGVFDLVYGHHAHAVQPWTKINGTWVIYGVSNFVGQMRTTTPMAEEGVIADLTFTKGPAGRWEVTRTAYVPIYVTHATDGKPARLVRVTDPAATEVASKTRLAQARQRTRDAVDALGAEGIVEE